MATLKERLIEKKFKRGEYPTSVEGMIYTKTVPGWRTTPGEIERLLMLLKKRRKEQERFFKGSPYGKPFRET